MRQRQPLDSILIKPAGPDCNLACRYCFYLDRAALFPHQNVHRMNAAVLEATVRQVLSQDRPQASFGWQGGEPTLMGVEFFAQAVEMQKRYGRPNQTVANGLQTNGLLIDDNWCRLLRNARFLVGLSLDGPRHVHDHYRRSRGGQPTWDNVTDALQRLLDHGVDVNALVVVNDHSARFPREIYDFLKTAGLRHFQFIPCVETDPSDPDCVAPFSTTPADFGRFLSETFDCWWADFRDGRPTTFIRWFDSVFATYVGVPPPECTLLPECAGTLVVEHNGDVFPCDFFVEETSKLGNVLTDHLADLLNSPPQYRFRRRKTDLPTDCPTCRWLPHCAGGCPKHWRAAPTHQPSSYLCAAYQAFFAHADDRLRQLAESWRREHDETPAVHPAGAAPPKPRLRVGRNTPCPCGSGRKHKHCCGR